MRSSQTKSQRTYGPASLAISSSEIANATQPALNLDRRGLDPNGYNDDTLVRHAISSAIKACPLSREEIADHMTQLLGTRVTEKMLNAFTGESKQSHRWPAAWDRAFCRVTGDDVLLVCRVLAAGLFVITPEQKDLLELGCEYLRQQRANEKVASLEKRLAGVEL